MSDTSTVEKKNKTKQNNTIASNRYWRVSSFWTPVLVIQTEDVWFTMSAAVTKSVLSILMKNNLFKKESALCKW